MNVAEIGLFLLPTDIFQLIFLFIITGIAFASIKAVKKNAIPTTWDQKWHAYTPHDTTDDLDANHGSLNDLSNAVATNAEKIAEIMPGILLIIGLLGTFLGLGIALDKASEILQHVQTAGMDNAMNNLMGMMEGIGAKFKTSTWGILGFLAFKSWATINRFEERRLAWCIKKIKNQLDNERNVKAKLDEERAGKTIDAIEKLCVAVEREISSNRIVLEQNQITLDKKLKESEQIVKELKSANEISQTKSLLDEERAGKTIDAIGYINGSIVQLHEAVNSFMQANETNSKTMVNASNKMATAAENIGTSAGNLKEATVGLKSEIGTVLNSLDKNLEKTISNMSTDLKNATNDISQAVGTMSEELKGAVNTIGEEAQKATKLQQEALEKTISNMSTDLKNATNDISQAVGTMSEELKEATKLQQKAFTAFETTSEILDENVSGMTKLVENLKLDITTGLDAVSDKRQQTKEAMSGIKNASNKLIEMSNEMLQLKSILTGFAQQKQEARGLLEKIAANTTPRTSDT